MKGCRPRPLDDGGTGIKSIAKIRLAGNSIMNGAGDNISTTGAKESKGLRGRVIPLLILLLVIAISTGILYYCGRNPEVVEGLRSYGYLGAFLISLIGTEVI